MFDRNKTKYTHWRMSIIRTRIHAVNNKILTLDMSQAGFCFIESAYHADRARAVTNSTNDGLFPAALVALPAETMMAAG